MSDNIIRLADRIKEISYTMGTGNMALDGAIAGFNSFASYYNNNDNLFYAITDGTSYEVGSGIFLSDTYDELVRFPISSSNSNQLVDFSEGVKEVYVTYPASHSVYTGSGISDLNTPNTNGIAFWASQNTLDYDQSLFWDKEFKRLGINNTEPDYGIHLGGDGAESIVKASGFIVNTSGIYFPPMNDGDSEYEGGVQLTHYEKNRLDQYAFDNNLIDELTGSNTVLELSGVANQFILFKKQNAGTVFAGPPSGCTAPCSPDYPYFRQLTLADLPDLSAISGVNNTQLINLSGILNNSITTVSGIANYGLVASGMSVVSSGIASIASGIATTANNIATFASGVAYSISGVLRTDITTVSGIVAAQTNGIVYNSVANGRLTLESNVAVSTSDQTSKSTVYYTPFNGNSISLYNTTSSKWEIITFTQVSLNLGTLVANKNYDIFGYNDNGSLTLELGTAWASDTVRSTNIIIQNGVYCKNGNLTRRYLGTIRTTTTTSTEDSLIRRFVWNADNRVSRKVYYASATGPWTYSTDSWRAINNVSYNIEVINGLSFGTINLSAGVLYATPQQSVTYTYYFGIAKDGATSSSIVGTRSQTYGNSTQAQLSTQTIDYTGLGYHYYYPVERVYGNNTVTLYGSNAGSYFGGIYGTWEC
ncbi:hypothetical protein EB001_03960 [bacterium]|nr:hypothetical protein [bacterium]